jgi:ATP-dependent Lon protease
VPKDGPSAGLALVLALLSAVRGEPRPGGLVSTGEITLSGRVLPVGGVRAKLLAAERAGARRALVPRACQSDVPSGLGLEVTYVERVEEVVTAVIGASVAPQSAPPASPQAAARETPSKPRRATRAPTRAPEP